MQTISEIMLNSISDTLSVKFSTIIKLIHDELITKYNIHENDMLNIWNKVVPDIKLNFSKSIPNTSYNLNNKNNCKNVDDNDCCIFIFKKGGRKGERCDRNKAKKSKLGYCSIHIKEENHDVCNEDTTDKNCCFVFKKGQKKGETCTSKVSKSSKQGYCVIHKKEENNLNEDKIIKKEVVVNKSNKFDDSDAEYESDNSSDCESSDDDKEDTKLNVSKIIKQVKSESSSDEDSDDDCYKKS